MNLRELHSVLDLEFEGCFSEWPRAPYWWALGGVWDFLWSIRWVVSGQLYFLVIQHTRYDCNSRLRWEYRCVSRAVRVNTAVHIREINQMIGPKLGQPNDRLPLHFIPHGEPVFRHGITKTPSHRDYSHPHWRFWFWAWLCRRAHSCTHYLHSTVTRWS